MSRSHHSTRARPIGRAAMLFAALLAVFVQAFVVQTHVHAYAPALASAYEQTGEDVASDVHVINADQAFSCAICDVLAAAGQTVLPSAHDVAVETVAANEAAALAIRRAPRALTHSWQSRAPPIAL